MAKESVVSSFRGSYRAFYRRFPGALLMAGIKYCLITRAYFDGVVCGSLFNELEMIDNGTGRV